MMANTSLTKTGMDLFKADRLAEELEDLILSAHGLIQTILLVESKTGEDLVSSSETYFFQNVVHR